MEKLTQALEASKRHTDSCGVCTSAKAHGRLDWRCETGIRLTRQVDRAAAAAARGK